MVFLVALFPARLAFSWLAPDEAGAVAVSGTVWSGRIVGLAWDRQELGDLTWELSPLRLLALSIGGDFRAELNGGFCEGFGRIGLSGTADFSELNCLSALDLQGYVPGVQGVAQISAQMKQLRVVEQWPTRADGIIALGQLAMEFPGTGMEPLNMPGIDVTVTTLSGSGSEEVTRGEFVDRGGPVELAGQVTLSPERNWLAEGTIGLRDSNRPDLEAGLAFLGPADNQGLRRFSLEGSL